MRIISFRTRSRFVTACQQLLAFGVVVAVLTPAMGVVSLDVVRSPSGVVARTYGTNAAALTAEVPLGPVGARLREIPLTAPNGAARVPQVRGRSAAREPAGGVGRLGDGKTEIVSAPESFGGEVGVVGLTWSPATTYDEGRITVEVRTHQRAGWSEWIEMHYDAEHGPDADSAEAGGARAGTDEAVVASADQVQVRVRTVPGAPVPTDLKLAVVESGRAAHTARQGPEIDTAELDAEAVGGSAPQAAPPPTTEPSEGAEEEDALALQATAFTRKPRIFSRAQWGADERLRDGRPRYYEIHGGFVHHTVNANGYSRSQVPGMLRSIYAYHTQSRGWSDIGYNFLVDRFGRIWEGRFGGVDRPVVGAHTLGYNDHAFAASALGNFETARPSAAMVNALGRIMAWKLSLHGVRAKARNVRIGSTTFPHAIHGHRDAGSTACPGRYLYAQLDQIRDIAAGAQANWRGRDIKTDLDGAPGPEILVRRRHDGRVFMVPVPDANVTFGKPSSRMATTLRVPRATRLMRVGDWDRDGHNDVAVRAGDGSLRVFRGASNGRFTRWIHLGRGWNNVDLLAAVGDMTGDGFPDLMGQPSGGPMRIYPGAGTAGLRSSYVAHSAIPGELQLGGGLWDRDGAPDTLVRRGAELRLWSGNGPGGLTGSRRLPVDLSRYNAIVAVSDIGRRNAGHPDLIVRQKGTPRLYVLPAHPRGFWDRRLVGRGYGARYDLFG